MYVNLHTRSWFSFRRGASGPEHLAYRAAYCDMPALAITDINGVYGAVRFENACRRFGVKPIIGAEITVDNHPLVLLARNRDGYADLCTLLTRAHQHDRDNPGVGFSELAPYSTDLFCLSGGKFSFVNSCVQKKNYSGAKDYLCRLHDVFGERIYIELTHHLQPGDTRYNERLCDFGQQLGIERVATGQVLYAFSDDYRRYDLLNCIHYGITVFDPHPQRPVNAEAYLKPYEDMLQLIPYKDAFENSLLIADACDVRLKADEILPPSASVPQGFTPKTYLHSLCYEALPKKYSENKGGMQDDGTVSIEKAEAQLKKELEVIGDLHLEDFFLVVYEIIRAAKDMNIRCSGRGSAANSIVAYLLGITGVDPIRYHLLFERFLHRGRKGTPDIDVDFDSERRSEIISWIENRFGISQTAMTATVVTYGLRSAVRDVAKALGWPLDIVGKIAEVLPHYNSASVERFRDDITAVTGEAPLVDVLIDMVSQLEGCPNYLGQHSGGMVLSSVPLYQLSPIQLSANGVQLVQFDKDDVEAIGLVKFDVLGLRMLATISTAIALIHRNFDPHFDLDAIPMDDPQTFNMVRSSKTIGIFQIESQGQMHLLGQHQPQDFNDLVSEVALFRPGPLQSGMVNPFIRRKRGKEKIEYGHPDLKPILQDTCGIILFQEQVLEIAHKFAGMSLEEADEFRALMSKFRSPEQMKGMEKRFVGGAVRRGVPKAIAEHVFEKVSFFVGYGFCKSHAAAFANIVYQSAWLKCHFPAAYMAAFMQHRPGMYSQMTLEEESKRFGVKTLLPDIHSSGVEFDLEQLPNGKWAIRKPFTSIENVSKEHAQKIALERLKRPFESVEDLYKRVAIPQDSLEFIARSGALDPLADGSRGALWELGVAHKRQARQQLNSLFTLNVIHPDDLPVLPQLNDMERVQWDFVTHKASRVHPVSLLRHTLSGLGVAPIVNCYQPAMPGDFKKQEIVTVAGTVILRQKPPTANGVLFVSLEDETGMIQTVITPEVQDMLGTIVRQGALAVKGKLERVGNWRGILVYDAWPINALGGYKGFPSAYGGTDRLVVEESGEGNGM